MMQATKEDFGKYFTPEQLEENWQKAGARRKGKEVEEKGRLFVVIGMFLMFVSLFLPQAVDFFHELWWLVLIPGGIIGITGFVIMMVPDFLPRYSMHSKPQYVLTFLTCPCCNEELPGEEFKKRQVRVSYE